MGNGYVEKCKEELIFAPWISLQSLVGFINSAL